MATIKGGKKFAKVLKDMAEMLGDVPGIVRVGFLEGATAPDGQSIPLRAALNEYGHEHNGVVTPPRPFFRNMIHDKSPSWPAALALNLRLTGYNTRETLMRMGEGVRGQLDQSILELWTPPLAESTIKRKGFDKPLIESSDMLNATAYEVKI